MVGLEKSPGERVVRAGRRCRSGARAWGAVGVSGLVGAALSLGGPGAGGTVAARMVASGPSFGCWGLAASLLLRAWGVRGGRVRTRLLLLAGSAVAGGVYRGAVNVLSAHPSASGRDATSLLGSTVVTGVTLAVGLGMAGLVVAADDGTGRHTLLRRVLDGVVTAAAVFMTGWVLLRGTGAGWQPETGLVGVLWTAEVVFLSFLFALRRLVRSEQRATLWVGIVGLSLMLIGDTLRLWAAGPHMPESMSGRLVDACVTAGLTVAAVSPWVPGGASALGTAKPALRRGIEGAAAFIPLTVCTVTALGYALAPSPLDPVPLVLGGTALLGLWSRQTLLPREQQKTMSPSGTAYLEQRQPPT
ncbi:hypothetical protein [Streptomyces sp. NBC_00582]|uniref:hypothetical protein n=1 Tax=Streptomyces sp. NBC_00582 TaxID=2975783 RepID=UPI0010DF4686|nr:hypothetical protein [Streptomyces sp. NBC_00582]WUB59626.1 hypothetical protein OG852_04065 [Streptomyces sp. NBC_00582]